MYDKTGADKLTLDRIHHKSIMTDFYSFVIDVPILSFMYH